MEECIVSEIEKMAKENKWEISKFSSRIAKAKLKFFGVDDWKRCPCYPPDDIEHGCGSTACTKDIETTGKCHCNLFLKQKDPI